MNSTTRFLSIFMCCFLDFPESGKDCSTQDPTQCVTCLLKGAYFSGESIDAYGSIGHMLCIGIWVITLVVVSIGLPANLVIIKIVRFRRDGNKRPFDLLLSILAGIDFLCCLLAALASTASVTYFQNWDRARFSMYFIYLSACTMLLCRTASAFTTVLITFHNYLVIAFPLLSKTCSALRNTKVMAFAVLILSLCLAVPRFSSMYVTQNPYRENGGLDIPSLRNFSYIIESTDLNTFWYGRLKGLHYQLDTWLPLPLLILFNLLSFYSVHKMNKRMRELSVNRKDIQAITIFLPVVLVLCASQIGSFIFYFLIHFHKINYRETYSMHCLSVAVNSSINFPIYYFRSSNFRREVKAMFSQFSCVPKYLKDQTQEDIDNKESTDSVF
ncbi:unnamed protein product [Orchesella dallaii]|uniref:G-protein coupled receptors family 1 profile domain-containing protein n=1 Tax=Orchesella dallaii TaxID=48710 RepID=A0ABP1PZX4_9HEXA